MDRFPPHYTEESLYARQKRIRRLGYDPDEGRDVDDNTQDQDEGAEDAPESCSRKEPN